MTSVVSVVLLSFLLQQPASPVEDVDYTSLIKRARGEYWAGHFVQSESLFVSALRLIPSKDNAERAHVLWDLGDVYVNQDQLPKAEHAYRDSLTIYKKLSDKLQTVQLLR